MTDQARARCWVLTMNLDEALDSRHAGAVRGGRGRDTRLRSLAQDDRVAIYSPRHEVGGRTLQHFTGLGTIVDGEPWRDDPGDGEGWWRRAAAFEEVRAVPIRPLLPMLGFYSDEQRWGIPLRSGLVEITSGDFGVVAGALRDAATMDDAFSTSGRRAER